MPNKSKEYRENIIKTLKKVDDKHLDKIHEVISSRIAQRSKKEFGTGENKSTESI